MATAQQRLLRRILGEIDVALDPVRHRAEASADGNDEARESLFVTALRPAHELDVHASPRPVVPPLADA